ncbi:hypothetical protein ACLOJK_011313 [Asimina triloba]
MAGVECGGPRFGVSGMGLLLPLPRATLCVYARVFLVNNVIFLSLATIYGLSTDVKACMDYGFERMDLQYDFGSDVYRFAQRIAEQKGATQYKSAQRYAEDCKPKITQESKLGYLRE